MSNVEATATAEDKAFVAGLAKKARGKKAGGKGGAKATKPATSKSAKPRKAKAAKPDDGRNGSKKAIILELLRRKEGATLAELAEVTGWRNHSVHGFMSGHIRKKMGLAVESEKNGDGKRAYRIA